MSKGIEVTKEKIQEIKSNAPTMLADNPTWNYEILAKHLGISRTKLWQLTKTDEEFKQTLDDARLVRDMLQVELVENAFVQKLVEGKACTADYVFYLTNRAGDRWKDRRVTIHNDNSKTALLVDNRQLKLTEQQQKAMDNILLDAMNAKNVIDIEKE